MSTKRLAIRGVFFNWLGGACAFVIAFVVTPVLVRGLGNEAYGIWAVVISLTSYYSLADLGLRTAGVKYIAQYAAVQDYESVNKVVATLLGLCAMLSLLSLGVAGGVALAFPHLFQLDAQGPRVVQLVVLLTGFNVALRILGQVFGAALAAAHRFDLLQSNMIAAQVLQAGVMLWIVSSGSGLLAMVLLTNAVTVLRETIQYILARRALRQMVVSPRNFDRRLVPMLVRFGGLNLVHGFAKRASETSGSIIVGIVLGPAMVTFYSIAEALTRKANELNKGIHGVLVSVSSRLDAEQRRDGLVQAFLLVSRGLLAVSLTLAIALIALGRPLIEFWIGPEYAAVTYPLLCLLALAMVASVPATSPRALLTGMNHMRAVAAVGLVELASLIALGVVLTWSYGLTGMAAALIGTQLVTEGILFPHLGCRAVGVSFRVYVRRAVLPAVAAALPALAVALVLVRLAPPGQLLFVAAEIALIGLAGLLGTFVFCFGKRLRTDLVASMLTVRPLAAK